MKRVVIPFSLIAVLMLGGCKKDLLDINDNPNNAIASTPQLTMPVALEGAARVSQRSYISTLGMWMGYYSTPSGFAKPSETYTYDISNTFLSTVWDDLYNNIADFDYVEKAAIQQNLPVYQAVSKVMKVYDYHQLVDLWGNVPYSEALQGSNNFGPKYDDGQAIYEDLIKQLDSAVIIFKRASTAGTISLATDNQRITMFNSSLTSAANIPTFINKWVRFTNTLKLKLLMNQSQIPGRDAYIKANLAGLTAADFLAAGEDATENPGYSKTTGKFNPVFGLFYSTPTTSTDTYKSVKAADYGVKAYLSVADTFRIAYYYEKAAGPTIPYIGTVFGDPAGPANVASIGTGVINASAPGIILLSTESLFLQAEAAQRGYITGDPKTLYNSAITASFVYEGFSPAQAANYYSQTTTIDPASPFISPNWDKASAADKLQLIITQKWYALNGLDILAVYNDYRRTGFPPSIPLSTDASSKGKIPTRLLYPQRESLLNAANVTAQGTINPLTSTVFWDK